MHFEVGLIGYPGHVLLATLLLSLLCVSVVLSVRCLHTTTCAPSRSLPPSESRAKQGKSISKEPRASTGSHAITLDDCAVESIAILKYS